MARLKDWAQLVRAPNTLTASADSLAGFSLAVGAWNSTHAVPLVAVSIASICLYWAGMVLNDVNDVEQDRLDQRNGPLVDERISWHTAARFGWGLIASGLLLAFLATTGSTGSAAWKFAPVGAAALLAFWIVAYDSPLKKTTLGPWLMGLCRTTNMAMGISVGLALTEEPWESIERMGMAMYLIPAGLGLFVVGLTLAARNESNLEQSSGRLTRGWGLSLIGVSLIAVSASFAGPNSYQHLSPLPGFPILVLLLAMPWINRSLQSIQMRSIPSLVRAIKQAIMTILFLDAAVAVQFAGPVAGMVVCALVIPTFLLGKWFRMT